MAAETPPGWDGLLLEDERILWQGRPRGGIHWGEMLSGTAYLGLVVIGIALLWARGVAWASAGATGVPYQVFALPFVLVGLWLIAGRPVWDAYLRRRTQYTLTTHAAYIGTDPFGRRQLRRHNLHQLREPVFQDTDPGTIWFGREVVSSVRMDSPRGFVTPVAERRMVHMTEDVGFREIDGAARVHAQLSDAIAAAKAREAAAGD